jgi:hypothetical protein
MICFLLFPSKLSNKYVAKFVINEIVNRILDNLHNLVVGFSGNIETADNLKQWIIELLLKLQVLYYNDNALGEDNLNSLKELREQFISLAKYMIELYETNFILDRFLLIRKCEQCQKLMHMAVGNCLSRNSHERIDFIFNFISDKKFVKYVFDSKSAFNAATIKEIIVDLGLLVTNGLI